MLEKFLNRIRNLIIKDSYITELVNKVIEDREQKARKISDINWDKREVSTLEELSKFVSIAPKQFGTQIKNEEIKVEVTPFKTMDVDYTESRNSMPEYSEMIARSKARNWVNKIEEDTDAKDADVFI